MIEQRCRNCRHWVHVEDQSDDFIYPIDQDTFLPMSGVIQVRYCKSPKLLMLERPGENGQARVIDASDYRASFATTPDFGCINFEDRGHA